MHTEARWSSSFICISLVEEARRELSYPRTGVSGSSPCTQDMEALPDQPSMRDL
jgi:hypothetical protein